MVWKLPEHELHEARDSDFVSYIQEYRDFDCNSIVFNDVLYIVRAHENLFSREAWFGSCQSKKCTKCIIRICSSYFQEYEAFACNSTVFTDVLHSVRAHENCFPFHNIWFRNHKAWFCNCQSMNCTKRMNRMFCSIHSTMWIFFICLLRNRAFHLVRL